jgi:hypothetical protein
MKYIETPDITLKMIIDSGLIKPGTRVYASKDRNIFGNINEDGSITLILDNQPKSFPFPSGAARAIVKLSVNGWLFWQILDSNEYKDLSYFKKEYQKMFNKK